MAVLRAVLLFTHAQPPHWRPCILLLKKLLQASHRLKRHIKRNNKTCDTTVLLSRYDSEPGSQSNKPNLYLAARPTYMLDNSRRKLCQAGLQECIPVFWEQWVSVSRSTSDLMIIRIEPQSLQRVYDKNLGHAVLAWMAEHYDNLLWPCYAQ